MRIDNANLKVKRALVIVLDQDGAEMTVRMSGWRVNGQVSPEQSFITGASTLGGQLRLSFVALRSIWTRELPELP